MTQGKPVREKLACKISGCSAEHFGHGYCRPHYLSEHYSPPPKKSARVAWKAARACERCGSQYWPPLKDSRYCSMQCSADARKRPFILKKGYRKLLIQSHPRADAKGYVFEHIVIMEAVIGRPIAKGEEIHHKDHNRANNSPDNLVLCASHKEHMAYHLMPS